MPATKCDVLYQHLEMNNLSTYFIRTTAGNRRLHLKRVANKVGEFRTSWVIAVPNTIQPAASPATHLRQVYRQLLWNSSSIICTPIHVSIPSAGLVDQRLTLAVINPASCCLDQARTEALTLVVPHRLALSVALRRRCGLERWLACRQNPYLRRNVPSSNAAMSLCLHKGNKKPWNSLLRYEELSCYRQKRKSVITRYFHE